MDRTLNRKKEKLAVLHYLGFFILFLTLVIMTSLIISIKHIYDYAENSAILQARTAFSKDMVYRTWNFQMGPVFIYKNDLIGTNPYLPETETSQIHLDDGTVLVRINASYMLRLVHEMHANEFGLHSHLTSRFPLHPDNVPDPWERRAFEHVEKSGQFYYAEIQPFEGKPYMRYMGALRDHGLCLSCHKDNLVSTVRGGISVSVPMEPFWNTAVKSRNHFIFSHFLIWAITMGIVLYAGRKILNGIQVRNCAQDHLIEFNNRLEIMVEERTRETRAKEKEFLTFVNHTDTFFYILGRDGQVKAANKALLERLGVTEEELVGTDRKDLIPDNLFERVTKREQEAIKNLKAVTTEDVTFSDGTVYSGKIFPIFDENDEYNGLGGVFMEVSQQKQLEKDLRQAKEAAEAASKAKGNFLANVSHEIRTPLNGVIGMADLLLTTKLSPEQVSMASVIKSSGTNLLTVLNDILDFSKIEADKILLEPVCFDLRKLVFNIVRTTGLLAFKKHLELMVDIPPALPDNLTGDELRIRQVVYNLLSNAIKFTEEGEIILSVTELSRGDKDITIRIMVADTGIGIPEDKQEVIFAAFEQADTSVTRKYGGTGLGLAISSSLVALMDSKLCMESKLGVGSKFWFDITLKYQPGIPLADMSAAMHGLEGLKVLIVDDNATHLKILQGLLTAWGLRPTQAEDAGKAMKRLESGEGEFDLIITDYQMPEIDGLTFIHLLKEHAVFKNIPVIILSSVDVALQKEQAVEYDAVLLKPIYPEELLNHMVRLKGGTGSGKSQEIQQTRKGEITGNGNLSVLLVEDMEINQMVAKKMLMDLGCEVMIAKNGQDAVELYKINKFDLIFMDIQMPVMDGREATESIRDIEKTTGAYTPVVAMTAHALPGDREKYMAYGMDEYITKPLTVDRVRTVIEQVTAGGGANFSCIPLSQDSPKVKPMKDIFDENIIFETFAGNSDLIKKSMEIYIKDADIIMEKIFEAIKNDDNSSLLNNAHSMKSISGCYSTEGPYKTSLNLETMGRQGELPFRRSAAEKTAHQLLTEIIHMKNRMQKYLNNPQDI